MFGRTVMLVAVRADGGECAWSGDVGCTTGSVLQAGGCSSQSERESGERAAGRAPIESRAPCALWKLQSSSRPIDGWAF